MTKVAWFQVVGRLQRFGKIIVVGAYTLWCNPCLESTMDQLCVSAHVTESERASEEPVTWWWQMTRRRRRGRPRPAAGRAKPRTQAQCANVRGAISSVRKSVSCSDEFHATLPPAPTPAAIQSCISSRRVWRDLADIRRTRAASTDCLFWLAGMRSPKSRSLHNFWWLLTALKYFAVLVLMRLCMIEEGYASF